jgi:hypothetical protein
MDQTELSKFYYESVDILLTLNTSNGMNGFPLGVEAGIEGCVLLTTDPHNQNIENVFNIDSFFIIDTNNTDDIIDKIDILINKELLKEKSIEIQNKLYSLFNYDNTMVKYLILLKIIYNINTICIYIIYADCTALLYLSVSKLISFI